MQSLKSYNAIYCDLLQLLQFETAQARKPNKCYISSTDSQKYITRSTLLLKASLVPQKSWKVQPWKQPYGFYFEIISSRKKKKKDNEMCVRSARVQPQMFTMGRGAAPRLPRTQAQRGCQRSGGGRKSPFPGIGEGGRGAGSRAGARKAKSVCARGEMGALF